MITFFCRESKVQKSLLFAKVEAGDIVEAATIFCRLRPKSTRYRTAVVEVFYPREAGYGRTPITESVFVRVSFRKGWNVFTSECSSDGQDFKCAKESV
jgi:hypothetical protein